MNGIIGAICIFLSALFLSGCGGKDSGEAPPEGLIAKETFAAILEDVYLAEAKVAAMAIPYDSSRKIFALAEKDIIARHGVSDSMYRISMEYYFEHPDEMSFIFEAAVDSLSVRERRTTQSAQSSSTTTE